MLRAWLAMAVVCGGTAGAAGPSYSPTSIANASSGSVGPFAPNSVVSIYGDGLARSTHALTADDISGGRLPDEMNFTRVYVENQPAPILFVSEKQINFLIPSMQNKGTVRIRVVTEGLSGPEISVSVVDCAPALFPLSDGYAIATSADGKLLTPDAPAHPGDFIVVYLTGLGKTSAKPLPGEIPRALDWILALSSLKVTLGTVALDPVLIKYAGVTPGSGGLYQLNLAIPDGVGTDPEIKVTGDTASAGLKIPIRPREKTTATFPTPNALNL
jgi:uncharacterized protein (TIGR03437 family)